MADGASEAPARPPAPQTGPGPDTLTVPVDVGRRAMIVANLGPEAPGHRRHDLGRRRAWPGPSTPGKGPGSS